MIQNLDSHRLQSFVILRNHSLSLLKQFRISVKLGKSNCCSNVRHVALVPGTNDVVFPGSELCLRKGILALPMKGIELKPVVEFFVINTIIMVPENRTTLSCCEVLDSVEPGFNLSVIVARTPLGTTTYYY